MVKSGITVVGLNRTKKFLIAKQLAINELAEIGVSESGILLKEEVKASIAGQRAETRSVDTGQFLNSIELIDNGRGNASVQSDVEQAMFLEFGTTRMPARKHFRNSSDRLRNTIVKIIQQNVQKI